MSAKKHADKQLNWAHFIAGQAGVVPLSLGIPGVAKTATHQALAIAANRVYRACLLDQMVPEDLGGFPCVRQVDHNGHKVDVMARIHDESFIRSTWEPSVILFDEITNVGHAMQASALKIINEGIPGTWIFAAANPTDKACAGVELAPPMANRLCILQWETDRVSILEGWRNQLVFPAPSLPLLPADWMDFSTKWGQLVAKFIELFPNKFEAYPKDSNQASSPYPTPRSWTNVIRTLSAAESVNANGDTRAKLVHGCVGVGAGSEFLNWVASQDLPDPEALLANPASLSLPKRGDLALAIVSSVFNRIRLDNTPERWEAGREFLEAVRAQSAEIGAAAEGSLMKIKPEGHSPIVKRAKRQPASV